MATPPSRSAAEAPTALPRSPRRGGGRAAGGAGQLSAYRAAEAGEGPAASADTGGHFLSPGTAQQGGSP